MSTYINEQIYRSTKLTKFLSRAHHKVSLEIILTGVKKYCISKVLDGTENNVVWGAKDV